MYKELKKKKEANKNKLALGRCDKGIKSLIKQHADYEANKSDVFWIMKQIVAASRELGQSAHILYPYLVDLYQELFKSYQNQKSLNVYYREFMELVNMVKDRGALIKIDEAAEWEAKKDPNIAKTSTEACERGFEAMMAELFIRHANEVDFGDWRTNNKRLASSGNSYSIAKTINSAYQQMVEVLQESKKNADSHGSPRAPRATAQFAQVSNGGSGGSSRNGARGPNGRENYGTRRCYHCGSTEHLLADCPIPASAIGGGNGGNTNSGGGGTTDDPVSTRVFDMYNLAQRTSIEISRDLIVIDSASAIHIFMNGGLVDNIDHYSKHSGDVPLRVVSNGDGSLQCDRMCRYNNLKERVWFDKRLIANILSMSLLVKERRVFMDSKLENAFFIFNNNGEAMKFTEQGQGIYVHDTKHSKNVLVSVRTEFIAPVMLTTKLLPTVQSNSEGYTNREIARAKLAREQMNVLGWPTQKEHEKMIVNNTLHNSSVTVADIRQAYDIFGPAIPALQGKTRRKKPKPVESTVLARIPT